MIDTLKRLIRELLRAKTIHEVIAKDLREAHLKKLEAEAGVEYAISIVRCQEARIDRLKKRLLEHTEEGDYT